MIPINLSYIITTKNKIKYLPYVIDNLLKNIQSDEEIVVVDSNSTDGTKEYLSDLYNKKLIQKFLSEPDNAQAHGCNKALLMAEGKLLKIINDDDIFDYNGIRKCKDFMLENTEFDIMGMDGAGTDFVNNDFKIYSTSPDYINAFNKWKQDRTPFAFCDLGLMIRKSSLPYLGLFNSAYLRLDAEFTYRASALPKTKIAWYTGHCWVRMANEKSISICNPQNMIDEGKKLEYIYLGKLPEIKNKKKKSIFKKIKGKVKNLVIKKDLKSENIETNLTESFTWDDFSKKTELWLEEINKNNKAAFHF